MSYVPIRTATLRPDVTLGFDVYLHISDKYLLYVRSADNIEAPRLDHLNHKNVRKLYILDKDHGTYQSFVKESVQKALTDPKMPALVKADIVNGQSKAAVEEFFAEPGKKENYVAAQTAAQNHVALLTKSSETFEYMLKVAEFDKTTYQHSVNVATIAVGLANFLKAPEQVCQMVGLGGLLHDIGQGQSVAGESSPKVLEEMTPKEAETYRQHPRMGAEVLHGKKYISQDILDIILLHEERLDGKGFPAGLKKLDQVFQVVGLANLFDRFVTFHGKTPAQAYELILKMKPAPYDERLIAGLKDVLVTNKIL